MDFLVNFVLIQDGFTIFLGIIIEALPFIVLGVIVSNLLKVFVSTHYLLHLIPRNKFLAAISGSMIGFLFPVCECGNVPVARSLLLKKLPPHVIVSFLLAAPVFNPIVILATWVAFRDQPEIVILRVVLSLAIAIIVGYIFSFVRSSNEYLNKSLLEKIAGADNHDHAHKDRFRSFIHMSVHEFFEMTALLGFGSLIASFSQQLIPRDYIIGVGQGPVSSVIAMMLLAFVISICSNVDAFFALSYSTQFTSGSLLAFLVFGPMIDIKAVFMMRTIFRLKAIFYIALLTASLSFLAAVFLNLNVY